MSVHNNAIFEYVLLIQCHVPYDPSGLKVHCPVLEMISDGFSLYENHGIRHQLMQNTFTTNTIANNVNY